MADTPVPVEVFCSYAPADADLYGKLETHLSLLRRQKRIALWHERLLDAGEDYQAKIDDHLNQAAVILLLISPAFLASDYCYGVEMERALERHQANQARVVPILLKPVDWQGAPFAHLTALPFNKTPITSWPNEDEALLDVATGLRKVIENLPQPLNKQSPVQAPPSGSMTGVPHTLENARQTFDVFLCHHTPDKPGVKQIGNLLKQHNLRPWLDEWELRPGLPWQRTLEKQIEQIKAAAVFIGQSGIGPWQQQELEAFLREFVERSCPVIPVLLPDAPEQPRLPLFLSGMIWVDFRKQDPDPLRQLIWGITGKRPED
jgi:hypothetical protein